VDEKDAVYETCTRFLTHHYRRTPRQILAELAEWTGPDIRNDRYGEGELIERFEGEIAALLGKEAAVFMPSGTMCQQIALRISADRRGVRNVAFHPTCPLEIHERKGYQLLHGLHGVLVGHPDRLMTTADLRGVKEPLGALLLELPQREIGGLLPTWDDLVAAIEWARERSIPTHLDGARLWESGPFYARPYSQIAGLFDSVYVSFYKTLGGIAGSALAGPADMIAEARIWQRRHGGNLIQLFPYVLAAQKGLAERLGRIEMYCRKAAEIAAALAPLPQIAIVPNPPHTNMMHLFIGGDRERLEAAALDLARETGIWLFRSLGPAQLPLYHKLEFVAGDATLDLATEEIAALFRELLTRAASGETSGW
jgi:threonine aldolase